MKRRDSSSPQPPLEEPCEYFDLLYVARHKDKERIRDEITGGYVPSTVACAILDYILSPEPGKSTPRCKTVVIERRYYDRDHAKAFSAFYSRSFRDIQKECTRLHFFSRRLSKADLANLENEERFYLGFCVIRPFALHKIGRTVLPMPRSQPALEFPTCHANFEVNIGGSKLSVSGAAFMEQDRIVGVCASVALWMSTTTMAWRFGFSEYTTCEITERANQYLIQGRPMPSEGLTYEQMTHALRTMGYDPIFPELTTQKETMHLIYSYVESEIPPILLCRLAAGGDHSVVVVGHGYHAPVDKPPLTEIRWLDEPALCFARSSEWVPSYFVNDDQRGFYRKLTFIEPDPSLLADRIRQAHPDVDISKLDLDEWHCPVAIDMNMPSAGHFGGEEIANVWAVIVPLPQRVQLTTDQAERKSARLIRYWHWLHELPIPIDLVLRTYLVPSNEYKRRIEDSGMDSFVKRLYRGKPMPRWIWVTEISSIDCVNSDDPSKRLMRGEVIIDATSDPWTPDFIALHYIIDSKGYVVTMKPEHENADQALARFWYSNSDKKYRGWVR